MAKPFKFRYVNEIVGAFVLLVILLLIAGVIFAGHYQGWFRPVHTIKLTFPEEGSLGLKKGSEVEILNTVVGTVDKIDIDENEKMIGEIKITGNWFRFIRADSKAKVAKRYALAGDAFITITKGTGERLKDGGTLVAEKDTEILQLAQDLLNQVREATIPLLGQIRTTAEEYGGLAADLRDTNGPIMKVAGNVEQLTARMKSDDGPLMKILADLHQMAAGINNGEGTVGKLLRDPATAEQINAILKQVQDTIAQTQQSIGQVQKILDDVKKTTAQLPPMTAKVGHEADDLPGLVLQTQETLREAERLIEGIQKHWLIRDYIPQPKPTELIPPSDVGSPATGGKSP